MRNINKNTSKMKPTKKLNRKSLKIKKVLVKPQKQQVLVVAQEIKFARLLSGNEKKSRDRVLKTLKKWLSNCFQKGHEFKEEDFIRVWKGLFYAVWMSDKPLVQEELCENISSILDQFPAEQLRCALLMVAAGLRVLASEWYGIDHHRMDKFLMLVRRYLRGSLRCLYRSEWSLDACRMYTKMLTAPDGILAPKTPHYARNATSMIMHFIDCFLEELAKVSSGSVPDVSMVELLRPFAGYMCSGDQQTLCSAARRLLTMLLRQSEAGLRYEDATSAWKMMGCPRGGPEALELEVDEDEDDDSNSDGDEHGSDDDGAKPLDPRAGRVHVTLRPLPVPAAAIAALLREMLSNTGSKAHRRTKICLERFETLAKNVYPLPVEEVYEEGEAPATWQPTKAAKELKRTERQLVEEADELALRGLSRKHRKRLLAKSRSGESIVEEVAKLKEKHQHRVKSNGEWTIESTDPKDNGDTSNKENEHKKSNKRKRKHTQTDKTEQENAKKLKAEKKKNDRKINMIVNKRDNKLKKIKKDLALADSVKTFFDNRNKKDSNVIEKTSKAKVKNEPKTIKEKSSKSPDKTTKAVEKPNKIVHKPIAKATKAVENVVKKVEVKKNVDAVKKPTLVAKKVKNFQKQTTSERKQDIQKMMAMNTPKKVKFVLKNNSAQLPAEYASAVRRRPGLPFDARARPTKASLKLAAPAHRNPFAKNKK